MINVIFFLYATVLILQGPYI